jgi:hypothetical protein
MLRPSQVKRKEQTRLRNVKSQRDFLAGQGIAVREGAVLDPISPDFNYGEYQKSQAINQFLDAAPASSAQAKSEGAREQLRLRQYQKILAQQKQFSPTAESIADAQAGGSDPRTIAAYVKEGDRLTAEYRRVLKTAYNSGKGVGNFYKNRATAIRETGRDSYTGFYFDGEKVGMGGSNLSLLKEDITKRAKSEGRVQRVLGEVRQQRKSLIQGQQQRLEQRSGRRALLSSTAGGAGFLQGYFR